MTIKRCKTCKGNKTVLTLGALHKTCKSCNGVGFEKIIAEQEVDEFLESENKKPNNKLNKPNKPNKPKKIGKNKKES